MLPLAKSCIPSQGAVNPISSYRRRKSKSRANKEDLVFVEKLFRTVLLIAEECYDSTPRRYQLSCDVAGVMSSALLSRGRHD